MKNNTITLHTHHKNDLIKKTVQAAVAIVVFTLANPFHAESAMKKEVSFKSQNQTLHGDLYLPDNYDESKQLPGVIVSGSWTSVKEQMSGAYARKLADQGYAVLAFDFRGWGQSAEDTPAALKFIEDPVAKTADILAAADFLANRREVDGKKLATLGICASAGYAIDAAHRSSLITATAAIAPWLHDREIVDQVYGESVPQLLQAAAEAKTSKSPVLLEAASNTNKDAVMYQAAYYTDPNRGAVPEYDNQFNVRTWESWLNYDAIQTASRIQDPVLLVHSEAAAIPQGAKKFASAAGRNARLIMLDNITQFDFYDQLQAMETATIEVDKHFQSAWK
ncbi:MAG: alpha/beta fold hydrolase [Verrucomicrobiota bacterium]